MPPCNTIKLSVVFGTARFSTEDSGHSHRYTCSTPRADASHRENRSCRRPANIPPAGREAPAFTPGGCHCKRSLDLLLEIPWVNGIPSLTCVAACRYTMPSPDVQRALSAIQCDECRSIVQSGGKQALSFLLLDQLTIPIISCDDHLEQFSSICGLTTKDTADLLHHHPAGGISCPSCRLAPYNSAQAMIRVQDGAIVPMACPQHQSEIVQRFQTGLQTQQQLTSGLSTHTSSSL